MKEQKKKSEKQQKKKHMKVELPWENASILASAFTDCSYSIFLW